jgi:HEPN domain-containing protein
MSEDFASAALRHHADANLLRGAGRHDNSGYLAGYVVECSFKLLIACCGGARMKALGHDLPQLASNALTLAVLLAPDISRYDVSDDANVSHVLATWKPDCRYDPTGQTTEEEAEKRTQAAQACIDRIIVQLVLDGVLGVPR